MKSKIVMLCAVFVLVYGYVIAAGIDEKKGPEQITLDGGQKGVVGFPHRQHQTTLGDCNICHYLFPQKLGVIRELKNKGKLAKKRVMNHCRGCHRKLLKQGLKAGPTSCRKCHSK
jgi:hypothetical protein